jgi:DNA mismatch repair protein MutH
VFADHGGAAEFEPLSTTGVPLALREDWQELLAAAAALGTTTVWVAFHGLWVDARPAGQSARCLR